MNESFEGQVPNNGEGIEPGKEVADVLRNIGEEAGFDEETCNEIAELPFEEAFETAYSYLAQAGFDADAVLAPFMEETVDE